jgi:hypothetical protein
MTKLKGDAEQPMFHVLGLKAPVEFFERLDKWREQQIAKPSRPASIRWIVHQYLLKQEQRAERPRQKTRKRAA